MMLWIALISLFMSFGGLTSAYIIRSSQEDWTHRMILPMEFLYSSIAIVISSGTFFLARKALMRDRNKAVTLMVITMGLGLAFVVLQYFTLFVLLEQGL